MPNGRELDYLQVFQSKGIQHLTTDHIREMIADPANKDGWSEVVYAALVSAHHRVPEKRLPREVFEALFAPENKDWLLGRIEVINGTSQSARTHNFFDAGIYVSPVLRIEDENDPLLQLMGLDILECLGFYQLWKDAARHTAELVQCLAQRCINPGNGDSVNRDEAVKTFGRFLAAVDNYLDRVYPVAATMAAVNEALGRVALPSDGTTSATRTL